MQIPREYSLAEPVAPKIAEEIASAKTAFYDIEVQAVYPLSDTVLVIYERIDK